MKTTVCENAAAKLNVLKKSETAHNHVILDFNTQKGKL